MLWPIYSLLKCKGKSVQKQEFSYLNKKYFKTPFSVHLQDMNRMITDRILKIKKILGKIRSVNNCSRWGTEGNRRSHEEQWFTERSRWYSFREWNTDRSVMRDSETPAVIQKAKRSVSCLFPSHECTLIRQ